MANDVDGYLILKAVGGARDLFKDMVAVANKAARAIVVGQLKKAKGAGDALKVHDAIGSGGFQLIVDGLTDPETKAILRKIDPHNLDIGKQDGRLRRAHIVALSDGSAEPTPRPARAAGRTRAVKVEKSEAKPVKRALSSKAMRAVRTPK